MKSFITEADVEKALHWLIENADAAAEARANRLYLEEYTKAIKAQLMTEHQLLAVNAQERQACSDKRYIEHLRALRGAVFEDEKIRFLRSAKETLIESWRTLSATERAHRL